MATPNIEIELPVQRPFIPLLARVSQMLLIIDFELFDILKVCWLRACYSGYKIERASQEPKTPDRKFRENPFGVKRLVEARGSLMDSFDKKFTVQLEQNRSKLALLPFQKALKPSSWLMRRPQSKMPLQDLLRDPISTSSTMVCILIRIRSKGLARVMARPTPAKVTKDLECTKSPSFNINLLPINIEISDLKESQLPKLKILHRFVHTHINCVQFPQLLYGHFSLSFCCVNQHKTSSYKQSKRTETAKRQLFFQRERHALFHKIKSQAIFKVTVYTSTSVYFCCRHIEYQIYGVNNIMNQGVHSQAFSKLSKCLQNIRSLALFSPALSSNTSHSLFGWLKAIYGVSQDLRPHETCPIANGSTVSEEQLCHLYYQPHQNQENFVLNILKSSSDVSIAVNEFQVYANFCDGALIVIQSGSFQTGVLSASEQAAMNLVFRNSKNSKVPIFFVNGVAVQLRKDNFHEMNWMKANEKIHKIVNAIAEVYGSYRREPGEQILEFVWDRCCFGQIEQGWGFSVDTFSNIYHKRFKIQIQTLKKQLWSNNFVYNTTSKQLIDLNFEDLSKHPTESNLLPPFSQLILKPIWQLYAEAVQNKAQMSPKLESMCKRLKIQVTHQQKPPKQPLYQFVFRKWLPIQKLVVDQAIKYIPNPDLNPHPSFVLQTQYRNSARPTYCQFIKNVRLAEDQSVYALLKIWTGQLQANHVLRGFLPGYGQQQCQVKNCIFEDIGIIKGGTFFRCPEGIGCGNLALVRLPERMIKIVEKYMTFTDSNHPVVFPTPQKVSLSFRMNINVTQPQNLPTLYDRIKLAQSSNLLLEFEQEDTGDFSIHASSYPSLVRHVQELSVGLEIKKTQVYPLYREVMKSETGKIWKFQGPSKKITITGVSGCLSALKLQHLESLSQLEEQVQFKTALVKSNLWKIDDPQNFWSCGAKGSPNNILLNASQKKYPQQIQKYVCGGFEQACKQGVLCGEPLYGAEFTILDIEYPEIKWAGGWSNAYIVGKQMCYGLQLMNLPSLQEPIFQCQLYLPNLHLHFKLEESINQIFEHVKINFLRRQRECILFSARTQTISAIYDHLSRTLGQVHMFCNLVSYQDCTDSNQGDHNHKQQKKNDSILKVRKRKGMKLELPRVQDYSAKEFGIYL